MSSPSIYTVVTDYEREPVKTYCMPQYLSESTKRNKSENYDQVLQYSYGITTEDPEDFIKTSSNKKTSPDARQSKANDQSSSKLDSSKSGNIKQSNINQSTMNQSSIKQSNAKSSIKDSNIKDSKIGQSNIRTSTRSNKSSTTITEIKNEWTRKTFNTRVQQGLGDQKSDRMKPLMVEQYVGIQLVGLGNEDENANGGVGGGKGRNQLNTQHIDEYLIYTTSTEQMKTIKTIKSYGYTIESVNDKALKSSNANNNRNKGMSNTSNTSAFIQSGRGQAAFNNYDQSSTQQQELQSYYNSDQYLNGNQLLTNTMKVTNTINRSNTVNSDSTTQYITDPRTGEITGVVGGPNLTLDKSYVDRSGLDNKSGIDSMPMKSNVTKATNDYNNNSNANNSRITNYSRITNTTRNTTTTNIVDKYNKFGNTLGEKGLRSYGYLVEFEDESLRYNPQDVKVSPETEAFLAKCRARVQERFRQNTLTDEQIRQRIVNRIHECNQTLDEQVHNEYLQETIRSTTIIAYVAKKLLRMTREDRSNDLCTIFDRLVKLREKKDHESDITRSCVILQTYFRNKLKRRANNAIPPPEKKKRGKRRSRSRRSKSRGKKEIKPEETLMWKPEPPSPEAQLQLLDDAGVVPKQTETKQAGKSPRRKRSRRRRGAVKDPQTYEQVLKAGTVAKPKRGRRKGRRRSKSPKKAAA